MAQSIYWQLSNDHSSTAHTLQLLALCLHISLSWFLRAWQQLQSRNQFFYYSKPRNVFLDIQMLIATSNFHFNIARTQATHMKVRARFALRTAGLVISKRVTALHKLNNGNCVIALAAIIRIRTRRHPPRRLEATRASNKSCKMHATYLHSYCQSGAAAINCRR